MASDAAGNSATSNAVTVPDTQPASVSLAASAATAFVGQTVDLTATASDNVGVVKVEFHRNGAKVFEKAAPPFVHTTPAYTSADVGTQTYTTVAFDGANNQTTSSPVTVNVLAPAAGEVFVDAASGSDNNPGTLAAPFKTLAKAFITAAGGTVWLQNGAFTPATEGVSSQFTGRTVPAGTAIRFGIAARCAPPLAPTFEPIAGDAVNRACSRTCAEAACARRCRTPTRRLCSFRRRSRPGCRARLRFRRRRPRPGWRSRSRCRTPLARP